ncbi:MAG: hypothetical protein U0531_11935 [Dehalococcoidia bacterium]
MARLRIGITRSLHPTKPANAIPFTYQRYHDRVREAGGEPVDLYAALEISPAGGDRGPGRRRHHRRAGHQPRALRPGGPPPRPRVSTTAATRSRSA